MMCFYPVELSAILITASFEAINKCTVSVNFTHTSKETSSFQLLFFSLMARFHRYIYKWKADREAWHTHTVCVVCPSECRLLLSLSEAVAAGCGSSLTAQHWVETASNGSRWQTATVSPIIKTTNADLHFTVYFVTDVICHHPSSSPPYAFIGGHLRGDSTSSPLGWRDMTY